MRKPLFYLIVAFFAIVSCEEKPVVIPDFDPISTGKIVLIEELTGVKCPNCPSGSATLASIAERFPGNVVIVGVHGGFLTDPLSESQFDFRNEDSEELDCFLEKPFKPSAFFNRVVYPDQEQWGNGAIGQWTALVEDELQKEQVINLSIEHTYDSATRQLEMDVVILPLTDLDGDFNLTLLMTEGGIVDAQDNQFVIEEDYVHNHILRDIITGVTGDFVANTLEENKLITRKYSYTVPTDEQGLWIEDNLEIVGFIADRGGNNEEVLQATQKHLIK